MFSRARPRSIHPRTQRPTPASVATHAYQVGHSMLCDAPTDTAMASHTGATRKRASPARSRPQPRTLRMTARGCWGA